MRKNTPKSLLSKGLQSKCTVYATRHPKTKEYFTGCKGLVGCNEEYTLVSSLINVQTNVEFIVIKHFQGCQRDYS